MRADLKVTHEYITVYQDKDYYRSAHITFEDGVFKDCVFKTKQTPYDLDDWKWIGELSVKIQELIIKEGEAQND